VVAQTGIEVAPHLTCVGSSREAIAALLDQYRAAGVRRIVALRGDLPATSLSNAAPGAFRYANELVAFIRERHGEHFALEVAAYPEMHPQATNPEADFQAFVTKVKAGASGAVTQYFYNADAYFDFVERCTRAGLNIPVVPGVMPIVNTQQLLRFSAACGAEIPRWLRLRLESLGEDKAAVQDFGLEVVTRLCETLLKGGAPGVHFYTLNQAEPTLRLWRHLGLPAPAGA
jgi:methylenetetrahydrofolate reductase (NADPH)